MFVIQLFVNVNELSPLVVARSDKLIPVELALIMLLLTASPSNPVSDMAVPPLMVNPSIDTPFEATVTSPTITLSAILEPVVHRIPELEPLSVTSLFTFIFSV